MEMRNCILCGSFVTNDLPKFDHHLMEEHNVQIDRQEHLQLIYFHLLTIEEIESVMILVKMRERFEHFKNKESELKNVKVEAVNSQKENDYDHENTNDLDDNPLQDSNNDTIEIEQVKLELDPNSELLLTESEVENDMQEDLSKSDLNVPRSPEYNSDDDELLFAGGWKASESIRGTESNLDGLKSENNSVGIPENVDESSESNLSYLDGIGSDDSDDEPFWFPGSMKNIKSKDNDKHGNTKRFNGADNRDDCSEGKDTTSNLVFKQKRERVNRSKKIPEEGREIKLCTSCGVWMGSRGCKHFGKRGKSQSWTLEQEFEDTNQLQSSHVFPDLIDSYIKHRECNSKKEGTTTIVMMCKKSRKKKGFSCRREKRILVRKYGPVTLENNGQPHFHDLHETDHRVYEAYSQEMINVIKKFLYRGQAKGSILKFLEKRKLIPEGKSRKNIYSFICRLEQKLDLNHSRI